MSQKVKKKTIHLVRPTECNNLSQMQVKTIEVQHPLRRHYNCPHNATLRSHSVTGDANKRTRAGIRQIGEH